MAFPVPCFRYISVILDAIWLPVIISERPLTSATSTKAFCGVEFPSYFDAQQFTTIRRGLSRHKADLNSQRPQTKYISKKKLYTSLQLGSMTKKKTICVCLRFVQKTHSDRPFGAWPSINTGPPLRMCTRRWLGLKWSVIYIHCGIDKRMRSVFVSEEIKQQNLVIARSSSVQTRAQVPGFFVQCS